MTEPELLEAMHTGVYAPDLEYTPITAPLPRLVRREVEELRQKEGREAAAEIDKLRATLAAERARAEAAERERDELRVALVGGCEDRDTDEGEYYEHGMVG